MPIALPLLAISLTLIAVGNWRSNRGAIAPTESFLGWVGIIIVLAYALACFILFYDNYTAIDGFQAVRETVNEARIRGVDIENAALTSKMADANEWLAQKKAFNGLVDWAVPDTIMTIEPIR